MHAVRYAFQEAAASLWRGRHSALMSMATIAVALFVLGVFLLASSNLERLGQEWGRTATLSVYLHDDLTPETRAAIERQLAPGATVAGSEFVSKPEALRRFKAAFADLAGAIESVEANPLPESFEVTLVAPADAAAVEQLIAALRQADGVADVRYDRQWLDRLDAAVAVIRRAGFVLGALLVLAAALAIANVVRLGLHARREELVIMQLVGAPPVYVRGPFVVEGLLQGGSGAVVALIALALAFAAARHRYLEPVAAALNLSSIRFLTPSTTIALIAGGMVVGSFGGWLATRRIRQFTES